MNHNAKKWALAGLFKRINLAEDPKLLRSEASQLAKNIDPNDIAGAEQTLIKEGYPCRVVQQLSATFVLMGLHKRRQNNLESKLPDDHILLKMMAEHDLFRCYLADLNSVAVTIPRAWVEYYERKNGKLAEVFIETNGKLTIHPILKEVQIK